MNHWMRTPLITASLLGALLGAAQAHPDPIDGPTHGPAFSQKMRERMAEHQGKQMAELHDQLQLDAQQEPAWKRFVEAMQMHKGSAVGPDRAALAKLSTPERIDQMQAWHARMDSEMKRRGEAAKTFYASLNAEQKKVFDAQTAHHMGRRHGRHMHDMH